MLLELLHETLLVLWHELRRLYYAWFPAPDDLHPRWS